MNETTSESGKHPESQIFSEEIRKSFHQVLKRGIYKELHRRSLLSDEQLDYLLQNQ